MIRVVQELHVPNDAVFLIAQKNFKKYLVFGAYFEA